MSGTTQRSVMMRITLFLISATLFFHILVVGKNIIVPIVIAILISFLVFPMVSWLETKLRFPRLVSAICSLIAILIFFTGIGWFFGAQINSFSEDFSMINERYQEMKRSLPYIVQDWLNNFSTDQLIKYFETNFQSIFFGITGFVGGLAVIYLVPIYVVLMLIYRDMFYEFLCRIFQSKRTIESVDGEKVSGVDVVLPNVRNITRQYITGMFYVICVLFVLNSIALSIIGVKHAFLFAAFAAILNIVPFIGPLVGSALPILFAMITMDSLWYPVAVFASFVFIQTLESNLITPGIVGKNVSLNPLVTIIALFVGASIWGVVGMILFIPMVAILKELLSHIPGLEPFSYVMGQDEKSNQKDYLFPQVSHWISKKKQEP